MSDEPGRFRYARPPIDPEGRDSLAVLSRWIEPGATVLDLGAATGVLGRHLAERGCEVDGVEMDPEAARVARFAYRSLAEADLETADLRALFADRRYDAVVCADILEHLRDPGRILDQARDLLKPDGAVLISIPNVGYAGVLLELFSGEFTYRPLGILDATHLRFYTRQSLLRLLAEHGFHPDRIEAVTLSLNDTEFGSLMVERTPARVLKAITEQPDALVYQFIVRAALKTGPSRLSTPPQLPLVCFTAQLFWRSGTAEYTEANSVVTTAPLDAAVHQLRFPLPADLNDVVTFRLDPSDRPEFVQLHSFAEVDEHGRQRWSWAAGEGPPPVRPLHQLLSIPGGPIPTFLSLGEDPSFELQGPQRLQREGSGVLLLRISLLPTAETFALTRVLAETTAQLAEANKRLAESEARRIEVSEQMRLAVLEAGTAKAEFQAAQRAIAGLEETNRARAERTATERNAFALMVDGVARLEREVQQLRGSLVQAKRSPWAAAYSALRSRLAVPAKRSLVALLPQRVRRYLRHRRLRQ